MLAPYERTCFLRKESTPYYNIRPYIRDFLYLVGAFNLDTNRWLDYMTYRQMKSLWQSYMAIGEPRWYNIIDFDRILIWPFVSNPGGQLFLLYKAQAPTISDSHIPILPHSVGGLILEYLATAELLKKQREFTKSRLWKDKVYKKRNTEPSIWDQAAREIDGLARMDREMVLEPYRWVFHGGTMSTQFIDDEIPIGPIDGVNNVFTLNYPPNPANSLMLTRNGVLQYQGEAYVLSGSTITFNTGFTPQDQDALRANYRVV